MYIHTRYDDVGIVMRNWAFMVLYSVSGSNMGWDWCLLSIILEPWVNKFAHIDSLSRQMLTPKLLRVDVYIHPESYLGTYYIKVHT